MDLEAAFLKRKVGKKALVHRELDTASSSTAELLYEQFTSLVCPWRNSYCTLGSDSASV